MEDLLKRITVFNDHQNDSIKLLAFGEDRKVFVPAPITRDEGSIVEPLVHLPRHNPLWIELMTGLWEAGIRPVGFVTPETLIKAKDEVIKAKDEVIGVYKTQIGAIQDALNKSCR